MFRDVLKTLPQYLIPKHGITALAGYFADVKSPCFKNFLIRSFIHKFDVDMSEALIEDPKSYDSFNDFFIRHLKPECRPLSQSDIICPVDGCISEIGTIERGQLLQAKGKYYSVQELLACDAQLAEQFVQGQFATLYLSPKDYHRVHMPIDAELVSMTYIPGALFSVQPATTRIVPKLFARNERLAIFFKTKIGPMVMVMVGATIVGAIGTSWHGDVKRSKKWNVLIIVSSFRSRLYLREVKWVILNWDLRSFYCLQTVKKCNGIKNYWLVVRFSWVNQWQSLLN